ncbi:PucR family transcriptional regulator [Bacillus tuaregi]|uniref:PucR family transcriptional regulator n=1 Tax=Bacillus tuaregi TaxID=1816695 RepID=UPI0008F956F6|nr:helix-turn-helix domain-containing protein [Bacillus tuaregi]
MVHNPFHTNFHHLDELADYVSKLLHCPITIEDANHNLLSYSSHDLQTDRVRISTIIQRRVPEKIINQLWKEGTIPALLSSSEPIRVKAMDDMGFSERVAVSIWKKDEVLGFIWALEGEKPFEDKDLVILKQAAAATKNILLKVQAPKNMREERYQEFFWQLLTSHYHSNNEIKDKFHTLQMVPPAQFAVVIFQFSSTVISGEEEKKIIYLLKTRQDPKITLYTFDHSQLILLISLSESGELQHILKFCDWFVEKMKERYHVESIVQSIGGLFNNYIKVEKSYQQALSLLDLKGKFPSEVSHIHSYQELGIFRYLDILRDKALTEDYENYSLKKLHEYDQKYHTDLVQTLDVYLNNDSNVNEASKTLNIHTNTLNYRLKRIVEIGNLNLKDANQKMTIFLDLKLEKLVKKAEAKVVE